MREWCSDEGLYCETCKTYVNAILLHSKYGFFYKCPHCGNIVGCHPHTSIALGSIADKETRYWRVKCHKLFDSLWLPSENKCKARHHFYRILAEALDIDVEQCHFGHMDLDMLKKAYSCLEEIEYENRET